MDTYIYYSYSINCSNCLKLRPAKKIFRGWRGILSMTLFNISGKFSTDHVLPSQLYPGLEDSLLFFCPWYTPFPQTPLLPRTCCLKSASFHCLSDRPSECEYSGAVPLCPSGAFHFNLSLSEPVPGAQSFIAVFIYSTCFIILQYGPRTVAGYVLRECTVLWERQPRKQQLTFSVIGWVFVCSQRGHSSASGGGRRC